jgi:hypothetical protein
MNLLSEYFEGRTNRTAKAYATVIVEAQHPKEDIMRLVDRYGLNEGTLRVYRKIRTGEWDYTELPKHFKNTGIYSNLIQDALRSRVMYPKEIKELIATANDKYEYGSKKEKQPEIQPLDFESEDREWTREEIKDLIASYDSTPTDIAPNYNPTPPTEEQQQSSRMSVFFGFMLGIATMLLFILVERGTL